MQAALSHHNHLSTSDCSLTALLVLLIIMVFVIYPLSQVGVLHVLLIDIVFSLIVMAGALSVVGKRPITLLVLGFAVAAFVTRWTRRAMPEANLDPADILLSLIFLAILSALVMRQIFRRGHISVHRVQGAVAVYLLLGLVWACLYELVEIHRTGAFQTLTVPVPQNVRTPILVYFSFSTLTTVGYADVVAVHPVARSLAMPEALTGQLFPVILIARPVAMELESRRGDSR